MQYLEMAFTLFVSIVVAVITALISQKAFYKKEIWLRKEKRYSKIMDSLSIMQKHYSDLIDDTISIKKYNYEDSKEEVIKAQRELERLSMIPSFIIDSKVLYVLKALFHAASIEVGDEREGNYFSYFERMYGEIKQSINEIDSLARKDLKV